MNDERTARVRSLLREAFQNVPPPPGVKGGDLNAELYRVIRMDLPLFRPEDAYFYLPRILEELLDDHECGSKSREGVDMVITYLNPTSSGADIEQLGGQPWPETFSEQLMERSSQKMEEFAAYSREQALAIAEWLKLARNWQVVRFQIAQIDAGIAYWSERVRNCNEST